MAKRKLTSDEKKLRILQIFHEKNEFFHLKELEKIAPKEKGIVANTVKDVLQKLVDDGQVDTDKIGTSVYFWSFPRKVINERKKTLDDLTNQLEASRIKLQEVNNQLKLKDDVRTNSKEKQQCIDNIQELQIQKSQLTNDFNYLKENNFESVLELQTHSNNVKEAANRWTDNIFAIKSWAEKKYNIEGEKMNKLFGIPEDLDFIE